MKGKVQTGLGVLMAALFIFSGVSKLLDPVAFSRSIEHYQVISHPVSLVFALWIPWLECLAGAALLLKRWRLMAALFLFGLVVCFEILLAGAYLRGLDIDCGCFGGGIGQSIYFAFVRNIGLLAILYLIIRFRKGSHETS